MSNPHISTLNLTKAIIPVVQHLGGLKAVAKVAGVTLPSYDYARNSKNDIIVLLAQYAAASVINEVLLNAALSSVTSSSFYDWSNVMPSNPPSSSDDLFVLPAKIGEHKTFPVRNQLTALGLVWDPTRKGWVTSSKAAYEQAHFIVTGQPPQDAAASKNSNASQGKGSDQYQPTNGAQEAQTAPATEQQQGEATEQHQGEASDQQDDGMETCGPLTQGASGQDEQDDDMDVGPLQEAMKKLQEAMEQTKKPKAPSMDEDRVREIAREEATTLDQTLQENILAAVESAAKSALDLTPREVKTTISIASLPEVDASEMHPKTPLIAALVQAGLNVYMYGLPGTGKTHATRNVAKLLNRRYVGSISLSAGVTEAAIFGMGIPLGEGRYVSTPTMDAYENGGIMLWDEYPAADPNTMLATNQLAANDHVVVERRMMGGLDPIVYRHKDCGFLAAGNNVGQGGGQFVGTNKQDPSALDRWMVIHLGYDEAYEARLCGETIPNVLWTPSAPLADGEAPLWRQWVQGVRATLVAKKSKRFFSTRALIKGLAARSIGMAPNEVVDSLFAGWTTDDLTSLGSAASGPSGV